MVASRAERISAEPGLAAASLGGLEALAYAGLHEEFALAHIGHQPFLDALPFEEFECLVKRVAVHHSDFRKNSPPLLYDG